MVCEWLTGCRGLPGQAMPERERGEMAAPINKRQDDAPAHTYYPTFL